MSDRIIYELNRIENLRVPSSSELRTTLECRAYFEGEKSPEGTDGKNVRVNGGIDEIIGQLIQRRMFSDNPVQFRKYKFTTLDKPEITKYKLYSPVHPKDLIELYGKMRQAIFSKSGVSI